MANRRTFGGIRKLTSGRWQASYLDPITRKRVPAESTFASKADANRWLSSVELALQRGDVLDCAGQKKTLREYSDSFMATKTALRPKTRELYGYLLEHHILPPLGEAPLTAITAGAIRDWNADLRSGRIGTTTAAKAYRLLRQILQGAVDDRLIARNPCQIKGASVERSKPRTIPSVEDVFALADAIDPRFRAMVLLAAFAGLRRGECLGLARRHLDLSATPPTVTVEQSLVHTDSAGFILQPPKTDAGARTVAISQHLAKELESHLTTHARIDPSAFLFEAETPGEPNGRSGTDAAKTTKPQVLAAGPLTWGFCGAPDRVRTREQVAPATPRSTLAGLRQPSSPHEHGRFRAAESGQSRRVRRVDGMRDGIRLSRASGQARSAVSAPAVDPIKRWLRRVSM